jgi:hypothetical protein
MANDVTLPGTGAIVETRDTFAASGIHEQRQVIMVSPGDLSGGDSIGGLTETAPATDTASSGLNGRLQRIAQRITATLIDGANATFGVTTGTAVITDATGTLQQYLRGLVKLLAAGINVVITNANTNDSKAAAGSAPVTASFEDVARVGIITETAPGSDTASSGLNGRLQRIAQRISSLITLLPPALGTGGGLKIDGSGTLLPVSGTFWLATQPVSGTFWQATQPVSPGAAATGGATNLHFFSVTSGPAAVAIKASAGTLYGVQAVNTGAAPIYLKIYNTASGSVSVGTTVPLVTIPVPTTATTGSGIAIAFPVGIVFGTAISYTFTNLAADADATAVAVGTTLNVQFA